jgi:hypothetical protein
VRVPGSAKQRRSRSPPSSEGPGVSAPRLYFLAESIRCPSELRCLTRLKNVPIRVEAWVSWWTTPAARSIVWDRSTSTVPVPAESAKQSRSRFRQAVKVPESSQAVPFQSPGSTTESDHIGPTRKHKFQFRIQTSPITSIRLTSPVPVRVQFPFQEYQSVPDSAIRVRSHRSDSFLLFSLRFQVSDRTEINYFSWWTNSRIQNPSSRKSTTQVPLRSSGRFFTDLPRRPTLRTVRISVLRQNL